VLSTCMGNQSCCSWGLMVSYVYNDSSTFVTARVEGTADMMDWAALHARDRGAETWWKSFTTGKSAKLLGGVPHDTYGMTSLSIRQYVLGIYKQLGLREKDITKVQTGGPGMSCLRCQ
jgi:NAD-specific glutamate dehydrogenase